MEKSFTILRDTPAPEDAFYSHDLIAKNICDLINSEDSSVSIGLEGTWGSGKSTIIKFIEKHFDKVKSAREEVEIFVFDAWAHEGDELRKSFLDELNRKINSDRAAKIISKKIWETETIKTTTYGSSMSLTSIVVASILFILQGLGIYSLMDKSIPDHWEFLAFIPIMIVLSIPFLTYIKSLYKGTTYSEEIRKSLSFFDSSKPTDIQSTATLNVESSLNEFMQKLKIVLRNTDSKIRKIVLVVDNIDRLEEEKARQFWSSLAPFFEKSITRSSEHSNIFLLIPYSKAHVGNIFENSPPNGPIEDTNFDHVRLSTTDSSDGYLQKTFDITFYLRSPVLHKWELYMKGLLKDVFPELKKQRAELERIIFIYNTFPKNRITPRHVKKFINELNSEYRLALQLGKIPLALVATYIRYHVKDDDDWIFSIESRITAELLSHKDIAEDELDLMFSALHYGVLLEDAHIPLMSRPIENALSDNRPDIVEKFKKNSGFDILVKQKLREAFPDSHRDNPTIAINIVDCITQLKISDIHSWEIVVSRTSYLRNWPNSMEPLAKYFSIVMNGIPESIQPKFIEEAINLLKYLHKSTYSPKDLVYGKHWFEAALMLGGDLEKISTPNDPEYSLNIYLNWIKTQEEQFPFKYTLTSATELSIMSDSAIELSALEVIKTARFIVDEYEKSKLTEYYSEELLTKIDGTHNSALTELEMIKLLGLMVLQSSYTDTEILTRYLQNGKIYQKVFMENMRVNECVMALTIVATIMCNINFVPEDDINNINQRAKNEILSLFSSGHVNNVLKEHIISIFYHANASEFLLNLDAENELLREQSLYLLKETFENFESKFWFTYDQFVEKDEHLAELDLVLTEDDKSGLTRVIERTQDLDSLVAKITKNNFDVSLCPLYLAVLNFDKSSKWHSELANFIEENLSKFVESDWVSEVEKDDSDIINAASLLAAIRGNNGQYTLDFNARNALLFVASEIIENKVDINTYDQNVYNSIQQCLENDEKKLYQSELMQMLMENVNKNVDLDIYDKFFNVEEFDPSHMKAVANEIVKATFTIVSESDELNLQWMLSFYQKFPKVYTAANRSLKINLSTKLKGIVNNKEELTSFQELCLELIKHLKIKR